jgi:hypothetical protein
MPQDRALDKDHHMPRIDHWERLLASAIETARARPFVWGVHDCPTFAFETRMILTDGEDVAALWRGRYTTALGGQRVMRRLGWVSLEDMGRALLGEPRPAVLLAGRGDIVLTNTGLGFGICNGASAVGMAQEGLITVPLTSCRLAWHV